MTATALRQHATPGAVAGRTEHERTPVPEGSGGFVPVTVHDLDLALPLPALPPRTAGGDVVGEALVLLRAFGEPLAVVRLPLGSRGVSPAALADAAQRACGPALAERVGGAGGDVAGALAGAGTGSTARLPAFLADQDRWRLEGPTITVVVCTRDRPRDLERALTSLTAQDYPSADVLVVDNAPTDPTVARRAVEAAHAATGRSVRYLREDKPGLSHARNRALAEVTTEVVAWLDDDEVADEDWLTELAGAFCTVPDAAAASGAVLPAELRTWAQVWFEDFGGHSKGRGFTPDSFRAGDGRQHPLYPLPPFGVGANMAFRTDVLRELGGFDTALGAGTATRGGEDTLAFTEVLLAGHAVAYRPSALTWHYHRPDAASFARQMQGYGSGLTAFYTALVRRHPGVLVELAGLLPRAAIDVLSPRGRARADLTDAFPHHLLRRKTVAMLGGPLAYARAVRAVRRVGQQR